jgi:hypothetical protein
MAGRESLDGKLAPEDFVADVVWAGRALLAQPGVLIISLIFWCVPNFLSLIGVGWGASAGVSLLLLPLSLGWVGAERMFFLRRHQQTKVTLPELVALAPSFVGRFLSLGLRVGIVVAPVMSICGYVMGRFQSVLPVSGQTALRLGIGLMMLAVDLVLTFVPSALVYTTRSAREALRIGRAMIRQTWPRSALYVLCPPLALNMLNAMYPTHVPLVSLLTTAGLAALGLLAKGATAAFYLRQHPVTQAGADAAAGGPPPVDASRRD